MIVVPEKIFVATPSFLTFPFHFFPISITTLPHRLWEKRNTVTLCSSVPVCNWQMHLRKNPLHFTPAPAVLKYYQLPTLGMTHTAQSNCQSGTESERLHDNPKQAAKFYARVTLTRRHICLFKVRTNTESKKTEKKSSPQFLLVD